MSGFSPDGYVGKDALQGLNMSAPTDQTELSDYELGLVQKLFSSPNRIPATFFSYLMSYIEQANLTIPISQVAGFSQTQAQNATTVMTSETTTSVSYADLATVGPTLSNLPAGQYLVLFGALMNGSAAGTGALMSISVNAAAASDNDRASTNASDAGSFMRAVTKTLTTDNNTITAKYRAGSGTATFLVRWLLAIRYANS